MVSLTVSALRSSGLAARFARACALLALLALLAFSALVLTATQARANEIRNIAQASWSAGGRSYVTSSNSVSLSVERAGASVQTYVAMPGGPATIALQHGYCAAPSGSPSTVAVVPGSTLVAGQTIVARIMAVEANRDPSAIETLDIEVVSSAGDRELLRAVETAADSGEFVFGLATAAASGAGTPLDCILWLHPDDRIDIRPLLAGQPIGDAQASMTVMADPFGVLFDSVTGEPINGARVTLVDETSGAPARVFAFDGITGWPATVISGQPVIDEAGIRHEMAPGHYQFPLVALGRYRLVVEAPAPYSAPSRADPSRLALLPRPGGGDLALSPASFGEAFTLASLEPLQVDIPLDGSSSAIVMTKTPSRTQATPGDTIVYTVTIRNTDPIHPTRPVMLSDHASAGLRLRPGTLRLDGERVDGETLTLAADGRGFSLRLPALAPLASTTLRYVMRVRPDAAQAIAINRAEVASGETVASAQARIRIERHTIAGRMVLAGQVLAGGCDGGDGPGGGTGVAGVRLVLQDGSFAVTDAEGRYHFEGLVPGNHVVQMLAHTLPEGARAADCARTVRSGGSPVRRLVTGQGGSLAVADFRVILTAEPAPAETPADDPDGGQPDGDAPSGLVPDWLAAGPGPAGFVAPLADANPVSPAVRVAVRHAIDASVTLYVDGIPADPLSFEGVLRDPSGQFAISHWRGIRLDGPTTQLAAHIAVPGGAAEVAQRTVHFANTPMQARLVAERSVLVADGTTAPVIALRLTDRTGRPVHAGIAGSFRLDEPYRSVSAAEARQRQALGGFGTAEATWVTAGDDGLALIELEPTLVSGPFRLQLSFTDGTVQRSQEVEGWISPGDQPWTLVGLAETAIGSRELAEVMERGEDFSSDLGGNARMAFYAKGRVLGAHLLTLAYDSARQRDDQPLMGAIDPSTYYTVYADASQRAFDAQSRENLYLRIESQSFQAIYGDFVTGFSSTELGLYQRTATGVKVEARLGGRNEVEAQAFAARMATRFRRDELQGSGLAGPYPLVTRAIVPGSERLAIEVRDRLRPEVVLSRRELVNFTDYSVDLLTGSVTLSQPLAGRDAALNPQFLVAEYEVDDLANANWNAGLRASWSSTDGDLRIGASALSDQSDGARTTLGAADLRWQIDEQTELTAEVGLSGRAGEATATAMVAQVRRHGENHDLVGYVRRMDANFGTGQQALADRGRQRIGVDGRLDLAEGLSATASLWVEEALDEDSGRRAAELRLARRTAANDTFVGIAHLDDRRADASGGSSTVLEAGATQRLFGNRLELSAGSSLPLAGKEAIDLPARHRLGVRLAVTSSVRALAQMEWASSSLGDSRSLQAGFEVSALPGNRLTTTLGRQQLNGPVEADTGRTFAAFNLGQSLPLGERLTLDLLIDGNRTLAGGIAASDPAVPGHPVTSGGHLGEGGLLGEDYTAYSLGATWRAGPWSARGRTEIRRGELADRQALSLAVIRQLGDGKVLGGGLSLSRARSDNGQQGVDLADATLSLAWRPVGSPLALLSRLELRSDRVTGAVAGQAGPVGPSALEVDGDALSRRVLFSTSANISPGPREGRGRHELGLFVAVRQDIDQVEEIDLSGTTLLAGIDWRLGISEKVELGGRATARANVSDGTRQIAVGPELTYAPVEGVLVSIGYNFTGFRDPDFTASRLTARGVFASIRLMFDQDSLGLGARGNPYGEPPISASMAR